MELAAMGFPVLKFFPAEPSGGVRWLRSVSEPLPQIRFCPTGGINADNAAGYLALQAGCKRGPARAAQAIGVPRAAAFASRDMSFALETQDVGDDVIGLCGFEAEIRHLFVVGLKKYPQRKGGR